VVPSSTLPLLVGLAGTLAARGPRRWRWNLAGLALSTAYLRPVDTPGTISTRCLSAR
jgi:hypothetical protein